ncbi:O-methyltransferase [Fusarium oxysporum f. sp. raphani]|uniref:O-methyltransferase n=1 Tax=Fusarium oxysporum f. sp. raphani TaxID=96318 RepID=A0A8J5PUV2_FUSOX|nr:O-methyltransferase [Fusarium oxysporum f. sp. raphani]
MLAPPAKWVEAGGGGKNCAELAELNKTDPALIKRLVRQISGQHLVIETAEDTYKPTPWVHALAADQVLANVYGGLCHFVLEIPGIPLPFRV